VAAAERVLTADGGERTEEDEGEAEDPESAAAEDPESAAAEEMMEDKDPEEADGDIDEGEDDAGDEVIGEPKAPDAIAKAPSFASISSLSGPSTSSTE
jgi:hypothetical protein